MAMRIISVYAVQVQIQHSSFSELSALTCHYSNCYDNCKYVESEKKHCAHSTFLALASNYCIFIWLYKDSISQNVFFSFLFKVGELRGQKHAMDSPFLMTVWSAIISLWSSTC